MLEILDMFARGGCFPAGSFTHFGGRGDAVAKAQLEYFHAAGMGFVNSPLP